MALLSLSSGGYSMVTTLPIGREGIVRAAEVMIDDYGAQALAKAMERAQELRSEGFESIANTWDLICQAIEDSEGFGVNHKGGTTGSRPTG